jgi:hypothetical protein
MEDVEKLGVANLRLWVVWEVFIVCVLINEQFNLCNSPVS